MEAYVHGVSTRKVDDLVIALGIDAGIGKSEVSRIYAAAHPSSAGKKLPWRSFGICSSTSPALVDSMRLRLLSRWVVRSLVCS